MLTRARTDSAIAIPGPVELLPGCPDAIIDLQTDAGVELVRGQWRYADARVEQIAFVEVGHPDDPLGPGLVPNSTYDVVPHAEGADFHDSDWRVLEPAETQLRLSRGRVCFSWYRIAVTVPDRIGDLDPTGASIVFEVAIDARAYPALAADLEVDRADTELDSIIARDAALERVAGRFVFTEGPVWSREGALLFSSPNTNVIYRWHPAGRVTVFRSKSGYKGVDIGRFTQPGSNGLTYDPQGRLTICQHGNRRVIRVEPHGDITVLADRFETHRLNSPNDLVYRSDGTLFFTDPPFGLPAAFDDPDKELPFSGVFTLRDGAVKLVTDELEGPNGLAFSPDERYLYVGNWDPERKVVMRYELGPNDDVADATVLFDMTDVEGGTRSTVSRSTGPATCTSAGPAGSGSFPTEVTISERWDCRSRRTTSPGGTWTGAPCT